MPRGCPTPINNPCNTYVDTKCIVYTGADLLCLGVFTNDRLEEILQKIDEAVCTATAGESGYSGYSGISVSGYSGKSGYSGYSGDSTSGYSGYSGSGISGYSGYSGFSGKSGY